DHRVDPERDLRITALRAEVRARRDADALGHHRDRQVALAPCHGDVIAELRERPPHLGGQDIDDRRPHVNISYMTSERRLHSIYESERRGNAQPRRRGISTPRSSAVW